MTSATQETAQYIETTLATENQHGLLCRHDIGMRLKRVIEEEATYGGQAAQQIAAYLGMSIDRLYKLCAYADNYSHEQLEQWATRPMTNGRRFSYNHLTTLLIIKTAGERLHWVERILTDSLSVRALRSLINDRDDESTKPTRKRKSIVDGLDQMIHRGKGMLKGFSVWQQSVFGEIDKPRRQSINPIVRNRIIEAQMMLDELSAEVALAQNNLARSLARVDQLLG
jgi:hypothetical protein